MKWEVDIQVTAVRGKQLLLTAHFTFPPHAMGPEHIVMVWEMVSSVGSSAVTSTK